MERSDLPLSLSRLGPSRGRFIVIEGIDGCGSTTQAERLRASIAERGGRAFVTREPTAGPVGMAIRLALQGRLLGAPGPGGAPGRPLDDRTLALLFAADRVDHLENEVLPQLASGAHVISDRYLLSSLAYQGDRLPEVWVREINAAAPPPDLTVYIDVDLDVALDRLARSRWSRDLTEEERALGRVLDRYRALAASGEPVLGPVAVVDGRRPADRVERDVLALVGPLVGC